MKRFKSLLLGGLILLVLTGCSTRPDPQPVDHWLGYLGTGSGVFGYLRAEKSRAVFEPLMADEGLRDVAGRTGELYFSLHIKAGEKSQIRLAALGDFPQGLVGWALDGNKSWTKDTGSTPLWKHKDSGLQVVLPENGVIVASSRAFASLPLNPSEPGLPAVLAQEMDKSDFYLVILNPGPAVMGEGWAGNLPVKTLRASFLASDGKYKGFISVSVPPEKSGTKGLAALVKISLSGWVVSMDESLAPSSRDWTFTWNENDLIVGNVTLPYQFLASRIALFLPKKETAK